MSHAVGMPAEADAPAPRNHIVPAARNANRLAKSSALIVGIVFMVVIDDWNPVMTNLPMQHWPSTALTRDSSAGW